MRRSHVYFLVTQAPEYTQAGGWSLLMVLALFHSNHNNRSRALATSLQAKCKGYRKERGSSLVLLGGPERILDSCPGNLEESLHLADLLPKLDCVTAWHTAAGWVLLSAMDGISGQNVSRAKFFFFWYNNSFFVLYLQPNFSVFYTIEQIIDKYYLSLR